MDPDDWELLDWARKSGKELFFKELHFDEKVVLEMDYFDCPTCSPRGPTKPGENPTCTCTSKGAPSLRSSAVTPVISRAPSRKFKDDKAVRPMLLANQDSISQVLFRKSDQENKFYSMTIISPRSPGDKGVAGSNPGTSDALKENRFVNVSLISPRTPRTPRTPRPSGTQISKGLTRDPTETDSMKENKFSGTASRLPPKSPNIKRLMSISKDLEPLKENRYFGVGMISPRSPSDTGLMASLTESESMKENKFVGKIMISPRSPTGRGIIKPQIRTGSREVEFPGFSVFSPMTPNSRGMIKPNVEPEPIPEKAFVGLGVFSPRTPSSSVAIEPEPNPVNGEENKAKQNEGEIEEEQQEAQEDKASNKDQKNEENDHGHKLAGFGALASIGVAAAATFCVLVLGGGTNSTRSSNTSSRKPRSNSSQQKRNST